MQDRLTQVREKIVYYWPTYGPPILGAVLVLLALFVGYRILSNRSSNQAVSPAGSDSNLALNVAGSPTPGEPNASVTLPEGVVSTPTPTPTPVPNATDGAITKGGQKLPETGFPLVLALPGFVTLAAGGFKLSKFQKSS